MELRTAVIIEKDGSVVCTTKGETLSITTGEPADSTAFVIPESFVERKPSEAIAELDKAFGKASCLNCKHEVLDAAYQRAQPK